MSIRALALPWACLIATTLASDAAAQLNLSWDDCGAAGTAVRLFACSTNSSPVAGVNATYLVGSFVSPGLTAVTGEDAFVLVDPGVPVLPKWWRITSLDGSYVGCRPNSVLVATFGDAQGIASCADYFGGAQTTGTADFIPLAAGNDALIRLTGVVPAAAVGPIPAGEEHYAFTLRIRNDLTTGTGWCSGCTDGVCLIFEELRLTQPGGPGNVSLSGAALGGRTWVLWNASVHPGETYPCGSTPVHRPTWGAIKSLYR